MNELQRAALHTAIRLIAEQPQSEHTVRAIGLIEGVLTLDTALTEHSNDR